MMRAILPLLALFVIRLTPGFSFQSAAVAAPVMIRDLGVSHAQAGLVLGAFMLPGIVVTVPAGLLAHRIGDRAVLLLGLSVIAAGAALASFAPGLPVLIAARAIGGAGGVAVLMLIIKMTADRYAGAWLATASAITITSWPAGLALGLVALGSLPGWLGWQATLGLAGLPAVAAMPLVPFVGRAVAPARRAASLGVEPMPVRRFVVGAVLTWLLLNAVFAIVVGFAPAYFVATGRSLQSASTLVSLTAWAFAIAIPFGGALADRLIGRPAAVLVGMVGAAFVLGLVARGASGAFAMIVLGLVFAAAPGPLTAQLGQAVPAHARAVVFGWYSTGSYAAMTLATWLAGWVRDATGAPAAPLTLAAALSLLALAPYALTVRPRPASAITS
ncbi:MAG TPA: MFS transporter [Acetobacteraceae bacterium]|nr:MFS transporter [Acetobacteraceae bacterium]